MACTMSVTSLWRSRSVSVVSFPENGPTHPCRFGLTPPVTDGEKNKTKKEDNFLELVC